MSGAAPTIDVPNLPNARVAIISGQWHQDLCDAMVAGATRALTAAGVAEIKIDYVPGSFELPLAAQKYLRAGFDAAVVLGVVIRGETPHFDYVCQGVTTGIMQVSLTENKPVGFGVLTVENEQQARDRVGLPGSKEDKGFDSAIAALKLLALSI